MAYIHVEHHLPGITGLLEYSPITSKPIRELTQILLRGPSTLSYGERELIASLVSKLNNCRFCENAHTAVADLLLEDKETCSLVKTDISSAPVSNKMKALLSIAAHVQAGGKAVSSEDIALAKEAGASDIEIHDTVLIASLFCLYNRYVDGLAAVTPENPEFYKNLASRIAVSYNRLPQGYDHLKNQLL
jgi:uncharacterized peroxidase-related enzyme